MKKNNIYIVVSMCDSHDMPCVKIRLNGIWLYVYDIASIAFMEFLNRNFSYFDNSCDEDIIYPSRVIFNIGRKTCKVTGYIHRHNIDSMDFVDLMNVYKHLAYKKEILSFRCDLLSFIMLFLPKNVLSSLPL